jgi:hypothetical protein
MKSATDLAPGYQGEEPEELRLEDERDVEIQQDGVGAEEACGYAPKKAVYGACR